MHDVSPSPCRGADSGLVTLVAKVAEIGDLVECFVGLTEVAQAFPCRTCGGRQSEPIALLPAARRELEDGLLEYIGAVDYLEGRLSGDLADLFSETRVEAVLARTEHRPEWLRWALSPLLDAIASAATLIGMARLNAAVADGWVGQLIAPQPCTC